MTPTTFRSLMLTAAAGGAAALSLSLTAPVHAQPYDSYGYDNGYSTVPGVTVRARPRRETSDMLGFSGAPVYNVRATRYVNTADLDLTTGWGRHVARERIERAAYSACNELDMQWVRGLYPTADQNDTDCMHDAVGGAMAQMPEAVDTDYRGY